jgi:hypothetical protein
MLCAVGLNSVSSLVTRSRAVAGPVVGRSHISNGSPGRPGGNRRVHRCAMSGRAVVAERLCWPARAGERAHVPLCCRRNACVYADPEPDRCACHEHRGCAVRG